MLHKQKFARNFEATPFLGESFFSDATQAKLCKKYIRISEKSDQKQDGFKILLEFFKKCKIKLILPS
jgi:hypothetical protein